MYFDENEAVMLAKISIEELRGTMDSTVSPERTTANLEEPPDRLTSVRLRDLFAYCLYTQAVDQAWSNAEQLTRLLESSAPYVALARDGVYEAMLRSDLGQSAATREMLRLPRQRSTNNSNLVPTSGGVP